MSTAVIIRRKSSALIRANSRVVRAGRDALAASRSAKWAVACEPGPAAIRQALNRAIVAQNAALWEAARADIIRAELASVWRTK